MELATQEATPDGDEVRIEELRGEQYLVAPIVLVREKVLNGGYLSPDEMQESEYGWNGRPVTAPPNQNASGHPTDEEGNFESANTPENLDEMKVGHLAAVEYSDDLETENDEASKHGLRGEVWIHLKSAKYVGEAAVDAAQAIANSEALEVSTGYFHRPVQEEGTFNGEEYDQRQTDLMPDHLALLPNEKGACSWSDGCGAPRVNAALGIDTEGEETATATANADEEDGEPEGDGEEDETDATGNQMVGDIVRWGEGGDVRPRYGEVLDVRQEGEPYDEEADGAVSVQPPAALIEVWRPIGGDWRPTGTRVARSLETITEVDEFPDPATYNSGAPSYTATGEMVRWNAAAATPTRYGLTVDVEGNEAEEVERVEVLRATNDGFETTGVLVEREREELTTVESLPPAEVMRVPAANLLDEARTPTYEETETSSWAEVAKTLDNFLSAVEGVTPDDVDEVGDLTDEQRQTLSAHTLLGDPDADTFQEVTYFPVVNPSTGDLNEGALEAVLSGRGAQADISEEQLESARRVARNLLNQEFDRDIESEVELDHYTPVAMYELGDEGENNEQDRAGLTGHARAAFNRILGIDSGNAEAECGCGVCRCGLHNLNGYMSHDIDALAEASGINRETIEGMSDEEIASLAESLDLNDEGEEMDESGEADESESANGSDEDVMDEIDEGIDEEQESENNNDEVRVPDEVEEEINALREQVEALTESQEQERRAELLDRLEVHSVHDRETLENLDTEALETLAEDVEVEGEAYNGSSATGVNYAGQGGGRAPESAGEQDVDEVDADEARDMGANIGAIAGAEGGD
jgi:hypothetical protein